MAPAFRLIPGSVDRSISPAPILQMRELRAGKANKNRDVAELDPHWVLGVKPDLTLQLC